MKVVRGVSSLKNSHQITRDKIRQFDWTSYVVSPYLPKGMRDDYLAIQWFDQELSRAIGSVKEEAIARAKLDFWAQGIAELYND